MLIAVLTFAGLAAVVVVAGTFLARHADAIAEATGWGRLLIGSVLLAGATSLPELTVDISAVRMNLPDLAVGDLLGSSLMNLLILAVLDLLGQSRGRMLSRAAASHALSGVFSIALTALAGMAILIASKSTNWTFLGAHLWVWLIGAAYALGVRLVFVDQQAAIRAAGEPESPGGALRGSLGKAVAGFLTAAVVILVAGPYLAQSAGEIARLSGLGNTFVGTSLVALCTSLPELAASYAALRMGAMDLAVGNVFGSNAFNMLLLLPLDLAFPGALLSAVSASHLITVLAAIVSTSLVIIGQLYQVERRILFLEPDALMVILITIAALATVYYAG
jgi:cation:H+ antiporter